MMSWGSGGSAARGLARRGGVALEVLAAEVGVHELPRVEVHVEVHRDERAMAQRSARRVTTGKSTRVVSCTGRMGDVGQPARVEGSGQ